MRQLDLVDLSDEQVGAVAHHGAADLDADDRLLDQDLGVVLPRGRDGGVQLVCALDPRHAERRARTRRLHEDRVGQLVRRSRVGAVQHRERGSVDARVPGDDVRQRLVHADRRALDAAADVRDAGELEQSLHRPVLARRAVQDREHRVDVHRAALAVLSDEQPVGRPIGRDHGTWAVVAFPCRVRPLAQLPASGLGDADVDRLVRVRVDARRDLHRRLHRHVVLLRAPPEQDRDPRPLSHAPGCSRSRRHLMSVCSTVSCNARRGVIGGVRRDDRRSAAVAAGAAGGGRPVGRVQSK